MGARHGGLLYRLYFSLFLPSPNDEVKAKLTDLFNGFELEGITVGSDFEFNIPDEPTDIAKKVR